MIIGFILLTAIYFKLSTEANFIQDDAFTSLRYVENFVNGKGLVFNDGERVEGYTNFLWVLILSAFKYLDITFNLNFDLANIAQLLSTVIAVPVLFVVYFISKKIFLQKKSEKIVVAFSLTASAMVLFTTPFIYWSVSGMETSLFVLFTLLSVYYFIDYNNPKSRLLFSIVSVLNSFLRPEGLFFFLLLISFRLLKNYFTLNKKNTVQRIKLSIDKPLFNTLLIYSIPSIAYLIFRLAYFGYPFPNTFYAKTDFSIEFLIRGWNYYSAFLETHMLYGLLYLPPLIQLVRLKTSLTENVLIGFCLVYTIMIIFIGGDVLPIYRFFLTIMPLLFILFINSLMELIDEFIKSKIQLMTKLCLIIILLGYSVYNYSRNTPEMMEKRSYESGLVTKMKIYADLLKNVHQQSIMKNDGSEKNFSVAMSTIGAFSYYSGARVIDLVGLTDEYTAHNPKEVDGIDEELPVLWKERHYNADYVLVEKPDYIIFPAGAKPSAFAECAIYVQEDFRKNYYMQLFYSKDLNQLLPVFTRLENFKTNSVNCGSRFVKHYIEANNLFLNMIKSGNKELISKVNRELDSLLQKCAAIMSEVNTLKGMVFYHARNYAIAEEYLKDASTADSTNAIARIYLKNIYFSQGKIDKIEKLITEILKYSPYAIPGLTDRVYNSINK